MPTLPASWRRFLTLVSPLLVIAFGHLVARLAVPSLGAWAWVPVSFTYWALMGLFIGLSAGPAVFRNWLRPSRGSWCWRALPLLIPVLFVPVVFLPNTQLLGLNTLTLLWLLVALLNPFLEEGYW